MSSSSRPDGAERRSPLSPDGVPPFGDAPSGRCPGRGWVNQATAAPVTATGHSTSPATPSTPAPA
ncbi:hypothetical protein GTY56_24700 [Streptomyces sp. SID5643]|nr:hypothetical protein [Streptomyces sp. SID5643]